MVEATLRTAQPFNERRDHARMRRSSQAEGKGYTRDYENKVALARTLRTRSTPAEHALWRLLRGRALRVKFRRQHPIEGYIVDFYCAELGLVVELDGAVHRANADEDRRREAALIARGLIVVRFYNSDVLDTPGRVLTLLGDIVAPLLARAVAIRCAR